MMMRDFLYSLDLEHSSSVQTCLQLLHNKDTLFSLRNFEKYEIKILISVKAVCVF